jgi:PPOX class probable FMN-dependent enzyme
MAYMHTISTTKALRERYELPKGRSLAKQLDRLDPHCVSFIGLSPFVVVATHGGGLADASPRGGEPGFVKVSDSRSLLLPDSPGNNRLDTLTNIIETGSAGLLFMIPGVDETLRVNGRARLTDDPSLLALFATARRQPSLLIEVTVEEAYLHCAKALMRSRLWADDSRQPRGVLPSMGQMINDQTGLQQPAETQQEMEARYAPEL